MKRLLEAAPAWDCEWFPAPSPELSCDVVADDCPLWSDRDAEVWCHVLWPNSTHSEVQRGIVDYFLNSGEDDLHSQSLQPYNMLRMAAHIMRELAETETPGDETETGIAKTVADRVNGVLRRCQAAHVPDLLDRGEEAVPTNKCARPRLRPPMTGTRVAPVDSRHRTNRGDHGTRLHTNQVAHRVRVRPGRCADDIRSVVLSVAAPLT
jgi:hypothetical protein